MHFCLVTATYWPGMFLGHSAEALDTAHNVTRLI